MSKKDEKKDLTCKFSLRSLEVNGPDGNPILDRMTQKKFELDKLLSNSLYMSQSGGKDDSLKKAIFAQKLFEHGFIEIDKTDLKLLQKWVDAAGFTTAIAIVLYEELERCEESLK